MGAMTLARGVGRMLFRSSQGGAAIAQTTMARFLIVGFNVCTGIITARSLGTVGRGEMSAMILWPGLLSYMLTFGFPTALRYWVRREPRREPEFLTVAILVAILSSVVAVAIGVVFLPSWLHNYSAHTIRMAQILMFACPEMMIAVMMAAMLEALGKFSLANTSRYVPVALTLATLIVLATGHVLTPFTAALAYTVPSVIVACWTFWVLRKYVCFKLFDPLPALQLLGSYGIRAYGIDILTTLSTQIDQVLVVALLGANDVGLYVVALNASRVINVLHAAFLTVLLPSAAGLSKPDVLDKVKRSARISTAIAVVFGVAL
jgi:O-antigen/teichoic acid export membrane protein